MADGGSVLTHELAAAGSGMYQLMAELFPICRSITGNGLRESLRIIQRHIPLELHEVPTGTQVFDWEVPREWNVRDAYLKGPDGKKVVDFQRSSLHVVNYSIPVHARMPLAELKPHLHSLPDHPDWVPYRTTYYQETWGLCLTHRELEGLKDGEYEVVIDSSLGPGNLTYGELYLKGQTEDEVLISSHSCHPSLCNDNLSGMAIATYLAKSLLERERRYSYRFIFAPGTIGAIAWLALNQSKTSRIKHGLVLTCVGDAGGFHYKKSRRGDAEVDRAAALALRSSDEPYEVLDFSPYGYDERQYCSPGFNLPVGCLMRSVWGTFPEYHTSADNLDFVHPEKLAGTLRLCAAICDVLEGNKTYMNKRPFCEPQMGKRGLYQGGPDTEAISARLWVLNYSDGQHSLLDIAERSGLPFGAIRDAAELLRERELLAAVEHD
ncbi:MAG: DUF4910 domain-containing protein [Terracidiphilus sp.]